MKRLVCGLVLMLAACGSEVSDGGNDASASSDAATDAREDVQFGLDTSPDTSCPKGFPGEGQRCTAATPCTWDDQRCGGTFSASCVGGTWKLLTKNECVYCPQSRPDPGSDCTHPAALTCTYWPVSDDACEACTCTAGKWSCSSPSSCAFRKSECKNETPCTPNTGCGVGMCSNYCGCGVDGRLHCSSTLC